MGSPVDESTIMEDPTGEIGATIRDMLEEHFQGTLAFNHILVEVKTDHEGDDYLHTYIVFDGNPGQLDPEWTMQLSGKL